MLSQFRILLLSLLLLLPVPLQAATLTLEQRVAQMFMVTLHGPQITEVGRDFLQRWQPGAVVLFTSNVGPPPAMTRLTNAYQQAMQDAGAVPLLISIDQEGGVVQRLLDGFTQMPSPLVLTAAPPEMRQRIGAMVGTELRAVGINMNLAPVADLETNPDNPIIRRRSFGNDPTFAGEAIADYVRGLQSAGVLATLKHFPGHGDTSEDSHATLPVVTLDRERLYGVEIPPFAAAIDAGAAAVLVAHIWYPALEPTDSLPASLSPRIISGVLRDELGFDGLVLTDAIDMNAIDFQFSYTDAAIRAINAGADLISAGPGIGLDTAQAMIEAVIAAVHSGEIPEARIREASERILRTKAQFGILDWQPLDPDTAAARIDTAAHAQLMDELFLASATIAYDDNDWLPLTADKDVALIFLATRAQIQQECGTYHPDIRWVGVSDYPSAEEIAWATEASRRAEVTVVFTQNASSNPQQQALVNALDPARTIAVALFSPYDWLAFPDVSAYVATYSPMRPAVPAACAVLFGGAPAQGRLAVTLSAELPAGSQAN